MIRVAFICDGEHLCNRSESCFKNGGECHHTDKPSNAVHLKGTALITLTFKETLNGDFMEVDEN